MPSFAPERFTDETCRRHGWWVLLSLTVILYLPGLSSLPLMDRDEPRFAHATVEMMQRGAWAIPYFNSEPDVTDATRIQQMRSGKGAMEVGYRFDKPPLTYWWMRLHYTLFGVNEFAARLHSVVATWLVALVTFGFTSRLAGARAGLAAGVAWLTTLQVVVHGRLCVADMPMVLLVALACWALLECMELVIPCSNTHIATSETQTRFGRWHWVLYLSLGLGFLAKGPIALLVPGLALVLWRFLFWRKALPWAKLKAWQGLPITLVIIAAWGLPALYLTEGLYWKVGMQEHVVERGTKAFNGRFPVPGYYLATALISLFPWIGLLPVVWSKVSAKWDAKFAFLVSWLAAPYIIFTLYATQLPHYVMPGFPAAMVLLMACGDWSPEKKWHSRFATVYFGLMAAAFLVITCYLMQVGQVWNAPQIPPLQWASLWGFLKVIPVATLALVAVAMAFLIQNFKRPLNRLPMVAALLFWAVAVALVSKGIRDVHPAAQLAAMAGPLPEKVDLIGWQYTEPSLVFHFNHHWKFPNKLPAIDERMKRKGSRIVVLLRREWTMSHFIKEKTEGKAEFTTDQDFSKEVDQVIAAHPDYKVETFTGLNAARASWAEVVMLVRK